MKVKLALATPFYQMSGYSNYIISLVGTIIGLLKGTEIDVDFLALSGDSYIERARNTIANAFMRGDSTHLLWIDSDMGWNIGAVLRMVLADEPFVVAGYPLKNNWVDYGCRLVCHPDGRPVVSEKGLLQTEYAPGGFMMVKKEVYQKLTEAFPNQHYTYDSPTDPIQGVYYDFYGHVFRNGEGYRDDIYFSKKWTSTGGKIWVMPDATIGHAGYTEYTGNLHEMLMAQPGSSASIAASKARVGRTPVHLVFPFSRMHLADDLTRAYEGVAILHPLTYAEESARMTPSPWVRPFILNEPKGPDNWRNGLHLVNRFLETQEIKDDEYYAGYADDDLYEPNVIPSIGMMDDEVVVVSMNRGQHIPANAPAGREYTPDILVACPENMRVSAVGGEQIFMKGRIFKTIRMDEDNFCTDGVMAAMLKEKYKVAYRPDLFCLFNYFEPGRWDK